MRHKFILFRLFLILNFLLLGQSIFASTPCKVTALQCEYLVNPLGIDAPSPRFTWQLTDARQGAKQTAYQILVNTDSLSLTKGIGKDWNTGKKGNQQTLVSYQGKPLQAFTKYYWRIIAWDKDGQQTSSEIASFETGMMNMSNWQGAWISDSRDVNTKPAPYFRKTFNANKKIVSARAYIAVAGLYELYINGEKISNHPRPYVHAF